MLLSTSNAASSTMAGLVSPATVKRRSGSSIANDIVTVAVCSDFGADLTKGPVGPWKDSSGPGPFPSCDPVVLNLPF